jgi:hypothetical protein
MLSKIIELHCIVKVTQILVYFALDQPLNFVNSYFPRPLSFHIILSYIHIFMWLNHTHSLPTLKRRQAFPFLFPILFPLSFFLLLSHHSFIRPLSLISSSLPFSPFLSISLHPPSPTSSLFYILFFSLFLLLLAACVRMLLPPSPSPFFFPSLFSSLFFLFVVSLIIHTHKHTHKHTHTHIPTHSAHSLSMASFIIS